jgi:hypothetical protein
MIKAAHANIQVFHSHQAMKVTDGTKEDLFIGTAGSSKTAESCHNSCYEKGL